MMPSRAKYVIRMTGASLSFFMLQGVVNGSMEVVVIL